MAARLWAAGVKQPGDFGLSRINLYYGLSLLLQNLAGGAGLINSMYRNFPPAADNLCGRGAVRRDRWSRSSD